MQGKNKIRKLPGLALCLALALSMALHMEGMAHVAAREEDRWTPRHTEAVSFSREDAVWQDGYGIDSSNAGKGAVSVSCTSEEELRILVEHGEYEMVYAVPNDGMPFTVPMSDGDGLYRISVMERVEGTLYHCAMSVSVDVRLESRLSPWLRPNILVPYKENSLYIRRAEELAEASATQEAFVESVAAYVRSAVSYDRDCPNGKLSEHPIDPDRTLLTGKGICIDYAALTTAMMRSQGIPARMAFGDVVQDGEASYHAWTEAWLDGEWRIFDAVMPEGAVPDSAYSPEQYF